MLQPKLNNFLRTALFLKKKELNSLKFFNLSKKTNGFFNNKNQHTFFLHFKLSNNNTYISVVYKNKLIFWNSAKNFKTKSKKFKPYAFNNIKLLCNSSAFFFNKLKIKLKKKKLSISILFSGLNKYKRYIARFFVYNSSFLINNFFELSFISHNGVRCKKSRRLAKKKRRKLFVFSELKKKKKNTFFFFFKAFDFFYIQDILLKLNLFFFFNFSKISLFNLKKKRVQVLRSPTAFGKQRNHFFKDFFFLKFSFFFFSSNLFRFLFLQWFRNLKLNKFSASFKILNKRKSFRF